MKLHLDVELSTLSFQELNKLIFILNAAIEQVKTQQQVLIDAPAPPSPTKAMLAALQARVEASLTKQGVKFERTTAVRQY